MKIDWHVGDVIRKARVAAGVKQRNLAALADMRQATLSNIEASGDYKPDTLKKIAAALKMRDADLLALIPGNAPELSGEERGQLLCDNPDHSRYQRMVDEIFHTDQTRSEWLRGGIATFHDAVFGGQSRGPGERQHDRFSASDPIGSGPGKTRLYRAKIEKVRVKP